YLLTANAGNRLCVAYNGVSCVGPWRGSTGTSRLDFCAFTCTCIYVEFMHACLPSLRDTHTWPLSIHVLNVTPFGWFHFTLDVLRLTSSIPSGLPLLDTRWCRPPCR
ncbi:Unknown protein, partial [Striga hermonthica]